MRVYGTVTVLGFWSVCLLTHLSVSGTCTPKRLYGVKVLKRLGLWQIQTELTVIHQPDVIAQRCNLSRAMRC